MLKGHLHVNIVWNINKPVPWDKKTLGRYPPYHHQDTLSYQESLPNILEVRSHMLYAGCLRSPTTYEHFKMNRMAPRSSRMSGKRPPKLTLGSVFVYGSLIVYLLQETNAPLSEATNREATNRGCMQTGANKRLTATLHSPSGNRYLSPLFIYPPRDSLHLDSGFLEKYATRHAFATLLSCDPQKWDLTMINMNDTGPGVSFDFSWYPPPQCRPNQTERRRVKRFRKIALSNRKWTKKSL